MTELYDRTAERLWEKIEFYKENFKEFELKLPSFSPWDDLCKVNDFASTLLKEVQDEYKYELSHNQASWAVVQAFSKNGGVNLMDKYNENHKTSLQPKA